MKKISLTLLAIHASVGGGGGARDDDSGLRGHVTLVAGGRRGGHSGQAIVCGGQVLTTHIDHSHHVISGAEAGSLGLFGLGLGGHLHGLIERSGGLLSLDEDSLDLLPLGGCGGDDETEPQREDDAQGDGGGCQPAGYTHLSVKT